MVDDEPEWYPEGQEEGEDPLSTPVVPAPPPLPKKSGGKVAASIPDEPEPEMTETQKKVASDNVAKMDLLKLTRLVWGDETLDGRSKKGKVLKAFLAGVGKADEVKTTKWAGPMEPFVLTDQHKKAIEEMRPRCSSVLELARIVLNDPTLPQMGIKYRAVFEYCKEVAPDGVSASDETVESTNYDPPATPQKLVSMVNEYVSTGDIGKTVYKWGQMTISQQREVRALMAYTRNIRFRYEASQFLKQIDRNLFISTFLRFTYDKPDLTAEEQDQYIGAAVETVNIFQIGRELQKIAKVIDDLMEGDRETRGQFMPMVELINQTRAKLDTSKGRLKSLIEGLVGTREKRMKDKMSRNASVLNLLEAWQKDETMRMDNLEMGEREKQEDKEEVGRLRDLGDLTALIAGQTEEEASR